MSRRPRLYKRGEKLELEIKDLVFGGKGIAKVETDQGPFTVFVQNAIPGQKVVGRVIKSKHRYAECKLDKVLERSSQEIDIPYQAIPGAPYATLPIAIQKETKKSQVLELFQKIGGIQDPESLFDEFISSPMDWHYRNKMEYSFSAIRYDFDKEDMVDDFGLGFKHRGTWWAVENLDADSGLFDPDMENKLKTIREYLESTGLPPWHPPRREGFFRYLIVRKSFAQDKLLIGLVTSSSHVKKFYETAFCKFMRDLLGDRMSGLIHIIHDDDSDMAKVQDKSWKCLHGDIKLVEELCGLEFEISLQSFFQPNPKCAEKLYGKAIEYLNEQATDKSIMDLFCGTGTIAQLIKQNTDSEVIGVDIVPEAIADAKKNAKRNGQENIQFIAADVGKFLLEHPEYTDNIGAIVLDPPRAGVSAKSIRKIIRLNADQIIYISCNPSTQARDISVFEEAGYTLKKFSIVDQFPHTSHVETVARFVKNG